MEETNKDYIYKTNPAAYGVIGCEDDIWSPLTAIDGSVYIKPYGYPNEHTRIVYGPEVITSKIKWYLRRMYGLQPCYVSEFESGDLSVYIEHHCDIVTVNGKRFEAVFSRVKIKNNGACEHLVPAVSPSLTVLRDPGAVIAPGGESVGEYGIYSDTLGDYSAAYPDKETLKNCGDYDTHFYRMRTAWNERFDKLLQIIVPDDDLCDAYKIGYIYTHIIRARYKLWVGANGYCDTFSHDSVGIIQALFCMGDFVHAKDFMREMDHATFQYPDGFWKLPWVYATYMLKTGDSDFIRERFDHIRACAHRIEHDMHPKVGIMDLSTAVDSYNFWTIDDESALTGLAAYSWLCKKLGDKSEEADWADNLYNTLLDNTNKYIANTQKEYDINYIPICPILPNSETDRKDPRDANWASMFLFGRWNWEGYLFGVRQDGPINDCVDDTYEWGINMRKDISDSPYNFGGFPHGFYSSAYNAGYGAAALSGKRYRDIGIKAYRFMIDNSMACPFGWWEAIWKHEGVDSGWDMSDVNGGGGSCPHMWGQATATKVLVDSIVSLKYDGTLIIGRGVPSEWLAPEKVTKALNFTAADGRKADIVIEGGENKVTVSVTPGFNCEIHLPVFLNGIKDAGGYEFDSDKGIVYLPEGGTAEVTYYENKQINQ